MKKKPHGAGILTWKSGRYVSGGFANGKAVGTMLMTDESKWPDKDFRGTMDN